MVGNGNQTAQVSGNADGSAFGFGEGDVDNLPNADIDDSAVSFGGGDATNVSDNTVDDGSAIAVGGNASGTNVEDNDTTVTTTVEDNDTTINDNDTTVSDNDTDGHRGRRTTTRSPAATTPRSPTPVSWSRQQRHAGRDRARPDRASGHAAAGPVRCRADSWSSR